MKKIFALLTAALAFTATPALAAPNSNFVGPRIDVNAGLDDVTRFRDTQEINYGATAGVDLPLGDRLTIGAEVNANNIFDRKDLGAGVRLGAAVTDNLLVYGNVGYAALRERDGLRYGGGVEIASGLPLFTKVEYRFSEFGRHEGLVGVGLRF